MWSSSDTLVHIFYNWKHFLFQRTINSFPKSGLLKHHAGNILQYFSTVNTYHGNSNTNDNWIDPTKKLYLFLKRRFTSLVGTNECKAELH